MTVVGWSMDHEDFTLALELRLLELLFGTITKLSREAGRNGVAESRKETINSGRRYLEVSSNG